MNKIVLIGCGGAGINIVGNLSGPLKDLGDGFSDIEVEYIDTSKANIKNFDHSDDNFHLVESTNVGERLDGSGSERRTNSNHIVESVRKFINGKSYKKENIGTYYIVFASGSGGSGSLIQPMVVKNLVEKDLPVLNVIVGDSSNSLSTINTLNTLATFNSIALNANKPLSVVYNDNAMVRGNNIDEKTANVDKEIFKYVSVLSAFLSGDADNLDSMDMVGFIDPSIYSTFTVPAGLYGLGIFSGNIELPNHVSPKLIRTLTTKDSPADIDVPIHHNKTGITSNQNVIERFSGQFPIHYVTFSNSFSVIEMDLKDKVDAINKALESATVDNVKGASGQDADEFGLVL